MVRTELTGAQIKDATVSLTADVTGTLPVAYGGTGNATNVLNNVLLGNGTGALQTVAPSTAGKVLRSDGTTWASTTLASSDVGLGNVDNTSDATKNAAAVTLTNKTLTTPVLNGTPTGTGVATAATASTLALRDSNANLSATNLLEGYTTTATAAATTTLTVASTYLQVFTGSTTQTVTMPVASTLVLGQQWLIVNLSTGAVTVQSSGSNSIVVLAGGTSALLTCILASGTGTASWSASYFGDIVASGKKLSVSNTLTLAGTDSTTITFQATDIYVGRATTDTLTNKRITKRVGTTTSSATPTINTDNVDFYSLTAQTADITSFSTNLSGTPTEAQTLWIAITGTAARAITWGASFEASTVALPTTTVTTARLDVGFVWNTVTSKWRVVAAS